MESGVVVGMRESEGGRSRIGEDMGVTVEVE